MKSELAPLLRLGTPIVLGEVGWMTMSVVDTMMVGRVSIEALGAVSVAGILFHFLAVFGTGLMLGLDTLVSQSFGAGKTEDCHRSLWSALWISVPLAPLLMFLQWMSIPIMEFFEVQPAVVREARPFLWSLLWSTPPLLAYSAFRRYLQGMNLVKPVMFSLISANIINAGFNWILIYGHWGAPAMGAEGSGWSTAIARVYMAAVLVFYAIWRKTGFWHSSIMPDRTRIADLLRLGFPAAMQIVVEVGVFALATTVAGRLAPEYLVAHMIALQAASISYMVPLGLGSAGAVRVGQAIGRGDFHGARVAGWSAIALGTASMGLAGVAFVAAPRWFGRLYTNDAKAIEAGVALLAWAALFQLFDGAQGVATGVLRGAGNTRIAAITHFACYWLIGLPVGYALCFWAGWAASGLWAGLCLAIILIGIVLVWAWIRGQTPILMKQG